ncbi:MAG: hypothetical protein E6J75_09440 [Deltaproteobacteria bacterium]|nr:MAG: hypothetical protein E6J79_11310 [Deltaproteobacteria bacterium]TMA56565.1 MAG: hypothetical protein E6J75_09440 [Deltaproteobacteria bacterium]
MGDPETFELIAAGLTFIPALVWGVLAQAISSFTRKRGSKGTVQHVLFTLTALVALHYALWSVFPLLGSHLRGEGNRLGAVLIAVGDADVVALMAAARHFVLLWPMRAERPARSWLAVNYGSALVAAAFFVLGDLRVLYLPEHGWSGFFNLFTGYFVVLAALCVQDVSRLARCGAWRPGRLAEHSSADAAVVAVGFVCVLAGVLAPEVAGTDLPAAMTAAERSPAVMGFFVLHAAGGLLIAVPFVVRDLGGILGGFLTALAMITATAAAYVGVHALGARGLDPELRRLADVAAILGIVLVLMPARSWMGSAIGRFLLRRSSDRWSASQAFLHTLSPELGVVECCRRTLAEIGRALQFRGAAILLADGGSVVHGAFRVKPIEAAWPRDTIARPRNSFGLGRFRELPLPLRDALIEADVVAVVPVASPRRCWGQLFVTTDLLGASFSDTDDEGLDAVANQLASLLDAAELLTRAVAVERSLAHAEKLAAIGEMAARIAHDIRNPVTAARSLAQQLGREPGSPFAAEHAVILAELERVERLVAALLRFARREDLRFEAVDVGDLARDAVEALRPRLEAGGIGVDLELRAGVVARADREKLRQVLVNLLDNAIDALGEVPAPRRLVLGVDGENGTASVRVEDSGPGVPAEALPRLFEPFFSLKAKGTGLGLAIAKRTVDAHGGRIDAAPGSRAGMTFSIELPLARREAS